MTASRPGWRALVVALATIGFWMVGRGSAFACPVCFGQADGPMIDAARLGVWLLLAVVLFLQGGFAAFFLYLRRRAREAEDRSIDQEWARLQHEHDQGWRSA
jgi:hypothetical protein